MEKLPRILSDHNPLTFTFESGLMKPHANIWTFERTLLVNEQYCDYMQEWIPRLLVENLGSASIEIVWDTLKAGIRGETLRFSLNSNKKASNEMQGHLNKIMSAEAGLIKAVQEGREIENELKRVEIAKH